MGAVERSPAAARRASPAPTSSATCAAAPTTAGAWSTCTCGARWSGSMDDRVDRPHGYSQDVERPGMLHGRRAALALSARARVRREDRGRAAGRLRRAAARGRRRHAPLRLPRAGHAGPRARRRALRRRARRRRRGARARAPRRAALACLEADYEPLPGRTTLDAALADGAPLLHADRRAAQRSGSLAGPAARRRQPPAHLPARCTAAARPASTRPRSSSRASGSAPAPRTRRSSRTPRWPSGRAGG